MRHIIGIITVITTTKIASDTTTKDKNVTTWDIKIGNPKGQKAKLRINQGGNGRVRENLLPFQIQ